MGLIQIGEYEYTDRDSIRQGRYGRVFKGRKSNNPSHVVSVKVIKKAGIILDAKLLEEEIKMLRELATLHHPNLVKIYDCIEICNNIYIIMEYCNGGDFGSYLQCNSVLSASTIELFLRQIANGMSAIHDKSIVHSNIKPQNILLTHHVPPPCRPQPSDITLKIAYLGNLRLLQEDSMAGTAPVTSAYTAPEVVIGMKYDFKADLWSLGITWYHCVIGNIHFKPMTVRELKKLYDNNADLRPSIPAGTGRKLHDLLINLLRPNPDDRLPLEKFYQHPLVRPSNDSLKDQVGPATVEDACRWIHASGGNVPASAFIGGQVQSGGPLFVARAPHAGAILPGKLDPTHKCAYVPWGGHEHSKVHYQILVAGALKWVPTHGSKVPPGALPAGKSEYGECLLVGRVSYEENIIIGKVQPSHGLCYIAHNGKEIAFPDYEVLLK